MIRSLHLSLMLFILTWSAWAQAAEGERPNVIVCMVDDMGFSDIGCYGSEIPTPNLDALAAEGVRFANFHNISRCCPSRAAILTGLYPHQTGQGHFFKRGVGDGYLGKMARPHVNLGHVARAAGYATSASGKWHVMPGIRTGRRNADGTFRASSYGQGCFDDVSYSRFAGSQNYFPARDRATGELIDENGDFGYSTHWYAEGVSEHIRAHAGQRPFMVYWTPNAPHYPLHALEVDLAVTDGMYDAGPRAVAEARMERIRDLGYIDPAWPFAMPEDVDTDLSSWLQDVRSDTDAYPPPADVRFFADGNRKLQSARRATDYAEVMEFYAAQIIALDTSIGAVVETLRETGEYENTLIIFLSDNGCSAEGRSTGRAWAAVSDLPYLRYKSSAYGGGMRTPMIMSWPARIGDEVAGTWNQSYGHITDVMPTMIEAIGGSYPEMDHTGERELPPLPGHSLLPILQGQTLERPAPIFQEQSGNIAVITEQWKIVSDKGEPWRLFSMQEDPLERNNVAADNQELVLEMAEQWQAWADVVGARPGGGSRRSPDRIRLDNLDPWDRQ